MQHRAQFVANYLDYYMFQRHSRAVSEKEEEEKEEEEVGGGARREVNIKKILELNVFTVL